jgi:hypothetical protein
LPTLIVVYLVVVLVVVMVIVAVVAVVSVVALVSAVIPVVGIVALVVDSLGGGSGTRNGRESYRVVAVVVEVAVILFHGRAAPFVV